MITASLLFLIVLIKKYERLNDCMNYHLKENKHYIFDKVIYGCTL